MKKRLLSFLMTSVMAVSLCACSTAGTGETPDSGDDQASGKTYKVGICNYVDDASLNQIVSNIETRLDEIGTENNVTFEIEYDNCNADSNVLSQIVANFIADDVDLMVGVATPVAMTMQAATEDNGIPVVFAAVSDPEGAGIVASNDAPGANITGTSDYLDTNAIMNLILVQNPDIEKVGLLYDVGQDSSTAAIADAKAFLDEKGIEYVEHTGTNVDEVSLAVDAFIADGVEAIFTPSDNTIMTAELSIYEKLSEAGILHYAGADSFALNGAFLGYGVDYANLGVETADMVGEILINGADPATTPVRTFDNGTATINTDVCDALGLSFDDLKEEFAPYCTKVESITTAESFE
ncbi:MAG: ABC transporter substrate-binding protein [Lachnospiraceae bacterium]|nr:ABC transporter substrate-binding protein [Lachnospiraceae bacterium]